MKGSFLALIFCLFLPGLSVAGPEGPGHYHNVEIDASQAAETAGQVLAQLVKRGRLDTTWSGVRALSAVKKDFEKGPEWVVRFRNDEVADESKKELFIFLTTDGKVIAANFTGT